MVAKRSALVLYAAILFVAWDGLHSGEAMAQAARVTSPQFDVTSVKENRSGGDDSKMDSRIPDRFVATNTPVIFLILYAYDLPGHQLIGAPEWTHDQSFDVTGTYPTPKPANADIRIMLQDLLADRFGLKVHREQRAIPAYDLVVARKDGRLGPQLVKSNVDCAEWKKLNKPTRDAGGPSLVSPSGKRPECGIVTTRKYITAGATTIQNLAMPLQAMVDKPVVDRTGLAGAYDIDLQWDPTGMYADRPSDAAMDAGPSGPSIFTAVGEQLGLRLVPQKELFDVLVVDQIKRPNAN